MLSEIRVRKVMSGYTGCTWYLTGLGYLDYFHALIEMPYHVLNSHSQFILNCVRLSLHALIDLFRTCSTSYLLNCSHALVELVASFIGTFYLFIVNHHYLELLFVLSLSLLIFRYLK